MKIEYYSNNSGGRDWLDEGQWGALRKAGWHISGFNLNDTRMKYASKEFGSLREGIDEWEKVTKESASALGCSCCGPPHQFTAYYENGDEVESWVTRAPYDGSRYGD